MSHGPPPSNNFFFADTGIAPLQDMAAAQMAADGQDGGDMIDLLGSPMFDVFDNIPMSLARDSATNQSFLVGGPASQESLPETAGSVLSPGVDDLAFSTTGTGHLQGGLTPQPSIAGTTTSTNTLTEFTKRRNWPAKVIEEFKDFLQVLDADGRIKYVSPNIASLTGYQPEEIMDVFLKDLVHHDDAGIFVAEMNDCIASGNPMRLFYRLKKKDGRFAIFETVGHAHIAAAKFAPNPQNKTPFCQAVFMMARPYPTKNASLLDSFLEHKVENERLRRRIAELRREEEADERESQTQWMQSQEGRSDVTPSEDTCSTTTQTARVEPVAKGERPPQLNIALTRENLEGAAGPRADSLRDKMARYESSHTDTIELLTGLRYIEGERSQVLMGGKTSPGLVKGDAGIAIPMDRENRTADKKKKQKMADEYVCTDCGTLDSPEWRKGPSGPKTLCNACGLRWAKREKKIRNDSMVNDMFGLDDDVLMG